jgi:hypothetical protein
MIQKDFLFEKWAHMNGRENFLEVTYLDNRNSSILPKRNRNLKFSNFPLNAFSIVKFG